MPRRVGSSIGTHTHTTHQGHANLPARQGVDVHSVDNAGRTALHAACIVATDEGALGVVTCLLAAGAPRRAKAHDGNLARDLASFRGHNATLSVLCDRQWAVLAAAAEGDARELVRLLTRRSVGGLCARTACAVAISERGSSGLKPIMAAARAGHDNTVVVLLEAGADIDGASSSGQLAIEVALRNGHQATVELLAERAPKGSKTLELAASLQVNGGGGRGAGGVDILMSSLVLQAKAAGQLADGPPPAERACHSSDAASAAPAALGSGFVAKLRAKRAAAAAAIVAALGGDNDSGA